MASTPRLRVIHGTGPSPEERAHRRDRRRRRAFAAASLALLPALWVAGTSLPGVALPFAALVLGLGGWAWLAVALFRSRCPRCDELLYRGPLFELPPRGCDACGLALEAPQPQPRRVGS
jgi:hypothetical protein